MDFDRQRQWQQHPPPPPPPPDDGGTSSCRHPLLLLPYVGMVGSMDDLQRVFNNYCRSTVDRRAISTHAELPRKSTTKVGNQKTNKKKTKKEIWYRRMICPYVRRRKEDGESPDCKCHIVIKGGSYEECYVDKLELRHACPAAASASYPTNRPKSSTSSSTIPNPMKHTQHGLMTAKLEPTTNISGAYPNFNYQPNRRNHQSSSSLSSSTTTTTTNTFSSSSSSSFLNDNRSATVTAPPAATDLDRPTTAEPVQGIRTMQQNHHQQQQNHHPQQHQQQQQREEACRTETETVGVKNLVKNVATTKQQQRHSALNPNPPKRPWVMTQQEAQHQALQKLRNVPELTDAQKKQKRSRMDARNTKATVHRRASSSASSSSVEYKYY